MTEVTLGDRMKRYEHTYRTFLPRRTYTLLRLDGRAFHSYTKRLERPFDKRLAGAMDYTAEALCREIAGAQFAYVQSDEISLLVTDFGNLNTEPWMGGNIAKILSLSAARASVSFNEARVVQGYSISAALFDSRVWTIADPNEVGNYFIWRQRDAVKNSISMAAQTHFSHKSLHGLNTSQMQEKLFVEADVNWNDYQVGFKRGRVITRVQVESLPGGSPRHRWEVLDETPHFTLESGSWLNQAIPRMPTLAD